MLALAIHVLQKNQPMKAVQAMLARHEIWALQKKEAVMAQLTVHVSLTMVVCGVNNSRQIAGIARQEQQTHFGSYTQLDSQPDASRSILSGKNVRYPTNPRRSFHRFGRSSSQTSTCRACTYCPYYSSLAQCAGLQNPLQEPFYIYLKRKLRSLPNKMNEYITQSASCTV